MREPVCRSVLVFILATCPASAAPAGSAAEALHQLFAEHLEWRLREFPEFAMSRGDYRFADRITDGSLAAIERRQQQTRQFADRLRAIDRGALSAADALDYDMFDFILSQSIEGAPFRTFLMPIGGRSGPQQDIPQMHERVRFQSAEDFENYLKRLEQVPKDVDDTLELLRTGMQEGRVPPKVVLAGVGAQFDALNSGGLDELATPFSKHGSVLSDAQRAALRARFDAVSLPAVRAALAKLGAFVRNEYIPRCRDSIAATDLPDGPAYYAYMVRTMTTTDLTPQRIHEIGLGEVARIRAEMMQVIRKSDFLERVPDARALDEPALFKRFIEYLRTDPRFYYKEPADLITGYRDICKRIDALLPKLFHKLPRLSYGVREIPAFMAPTQTTAYYSHGDIRNGEPGYFYANTYALEMRPRYEMVSLSMHEAVPGHHLQIALAQELEGVPEFRKDMWVHAFGEGWALYSERLGLEVGLYDDPYDDFGRLLYEMWRACRLVVDPGMHALGWSREQAIRFMLENTALSELNIHNEIDRYIAWPGQATAYKIGELKIRELRARAQEALGAKFDLRAFHDEVLSAGCVPLTLLESRIEAWIARQR